MEPDYYLVSSTGITSTGAGSFIANFNVHILHGIDTGYEGYKVIAYIKYTDVSGKRYRCPVYVYVQSNGRFSASSSENRNQNYMVFAEY